MVGERGFEPPAPASRRLVCRAKTTVFRGFRFHRRGTDGKHRPIRASFYRRFTARAFLAVSVIALTACKSDPPAMDDESIYERSRAVTTCPNGTLVGQDPVSKRYTYNRPGLFGSEGVIAPGVTPAQFCR